MNKATVMKQKQCAKKLSELTPMFEQIIEMKDKHPELVVSDELKKAVTDLLEIINRLEGDLP